MGGFVSVWGCASDECVDGYRATPDLWHRLSGPVLEDHSSEKLHGSGLSFRAAVQHCFGIKHSLGLFRVSYQHLIKT